MIDMVGNSFSKKEIKKMIVSKLNNDMGMSVKNAGKEDVYRAVLLTVRDILEEKHNYFTYLCRKKNVKRINYLCMEFLVGPSLRNNLYNLDMQEDFEDIVRELGYELEELYEMEADRGLGNGGLGRLAACFMDSLASLDYPATGYSLLYEYGIFKQRIVEGWQAELPDEWLSSADAWIAPVNEQACEVKFEGTVRTVWENGRCRFVHEDYNSVIAVPYDMFISGKDSTGVSLLRLWKAKAKEPFDMDSFMKGDYARAMEQQSVAEVISKVLYPADNHPEGKSLRLRQQYFLVSASIQNIVRRHLAKHHSLDSLPDYFAIHINDTHPALVIPELVRILMDDYGYEWDKAWDIVSRTVNYTNHTVLAEALETWPQDVFRRLLPRIFQIVMEINERFCREAFDACGGDFEAVSRMAVAAYDHIRMANLSVIGSHKVNGVSKLHSEIIKDTVFSDLYRIMPDKFTNVTNGIAHRRWLCQANPLLTEKIVSAIGDDFVKNPDSLEGLLKFKDDTGFLEDIGKIKHSNKERLAGTIKKICGVDTDPESIFDIQVKRLHEYKRQQMNALHILSLYQRMKEDKSFRDSCVPRTFIFGAKAAPGYDMAKQIIRFIFNLSEVINRDKDIDGKLKVVFIPDYRVSLAEVIIPGADVSQQISQAGKEASGTGNMKFMINGAVTLGTYDGANVEIHEAVGDDNMFIFGLSAEEVKELSAKGYDSSEYVKSNEYLKKAVEGIKSGYNGIRFENLADILLSGNDSFMVAADFEDYRRKSQTVMEAYTDRERWNRMALVNIAMAGRFAADRSIKEYADRIWEGEPLRK